MIEKANDNLAALPATAVTKAIEREDSRILKRKPITDLDDFASKNVKGNDWTIQHLGQIVLPRSITEHLSLELRDRGNTLVEETRELNNAFAGQSIKAATAILRFDISLLDLKERVLEWTEQIMVQVLYRVRHRIAKDPFRTYLELSKTLLGPMDQDVAHGADRLYQLAWDRAIDCMAYMLIDGCFLQPGHVRLRHGSAPNHKAIIESNPIVPQNALGIIGSQMNLFVVEPTIYCQTIVLQPLAAALEAEDPPRASSELQRELTAWTGDLLEAFPYLHTSTRRSRFIFPIRGTTCYAGFQFFSQDGFFTFRFADSEADMRRGLETNYSRGGVEAGYNGVLSFLNHPWLSLERALGAEAALRVSHWLVSQVHRQVVGDYLKIDHYYLAKPEELQDESGSSVPSDLFEYASWVREAQQHDDAQECEDDDLERPDGHFLPQLRRTRFFRLLRACGVEIEQGKGSEIKLLRGKAHPFRLGNHYGPNPRVPTLLAGQILKRLEITHIEWKTAMDGNG